MADCRFEGQVFASVVMEYVGVNDNSDVRRPKRLRAKHVARLSAAKTDSGQTRVKYEYRSTNDTISFLSRASTGDVSERISTD